MSANSKIEWTDHTFNPWIGCTHKSPGCINCYAESRDDRFAGGKHWGKGAPRERTTADNWKNPIKWNKTAICTQCGYAELIGSDDCRNCRRNFAEAHRRRPRVFCASLADWLDDEVPIEWLADLLALIHATPNLDWLLLTKRPELWSDRLHEAFRHDATGGDLDYLSWWLDGDPPPNVWFGVSVEDQKRADERRALLQNIPAVIRFVSYEPALEVVDWGDWEWLDWLIAGGESGHGARPVHPDAYRVARDFCDLNGIAFLFKQWGEWMPFKPHAGGDLGGDMRRGIVQLIHRKSHSDEELLKRSFYPGDLYMRRVGKKNAGRLLDGREYNGFPTALEAIAT